MGKDHLGADMRKVKHDDKDEKEKDFKTLDEGDIQLLKTYGQGPYSKSLKAVEKDITEITKRVNELAGGYWQFRSLFPLSLYFSLFQVSRNPTRVWDPRLFGTWPPTSSLSRASNRSRWPGAQRSSTPTPTILSTLSM